MFDDLHMVKQLALDLLQSKTKLRGSTFDRLLPPLNAHLVAVPVVVAATAHAEQSSRRLLRGLRALLNVGVTRVIVVHLLNFTGDAGRALELQVEGAGRLE